jgi:hypothetical protein
MTSNIDIIDQSPTKDADGFTIIQDTIIASVRAYQEERHGSERWANNAVFSEATCLFRFRIIPGVTVTTAHVIVCGVERYRILSIEDVRNRKMYYEALCSKLDPSMR